MNNIMKIINIVLPPRCPLSGDVVDAPGMVSPAMWPKLSFIAAPYCGCCGFPFEFSTDAPGALCAACLKEPPVYRRARAALVYDDISRDLILGFKHGDQIHNVRAFLPWLKQAGRDVIDDADILMPVPLHRWRILKRRYNQSAVIAQHLGRDIGKPVLLDGLTRIRATPTQGHLKAKDRERNVKKAFALNPARHNQIENKKILLIDDVYTTGSTVKECARVLMEQGRASSVDILAVAKVVRPERVS